MPNENHYELALRELVEKRPSQGLFAQCFAEQSGDEAKTKARYVELRASQLEHAERSEALAQQAAIKARTKANSRTAWLQRRDAFYEYMKVPVILFMLVVLLILWAEGCSR